MGTFLLYLIQVNALTFLPSIFKLNLIGPFSPNQPAVVAMTAQQRLCKTVDVLEQAGFHGFGWVHPGEAPGGHSLSDVHEVTHGAFLYTMEAADDVREALIRKVA